MSRLVWPVFAAVGMGALTVVLWYALERHEVEQIARIVESESYAARSRLVRESDKMLRAFRQVNDYWERFGRLPLDQWSSDAAIELDHFHGVELMLWNDQSRDIRFIRTPDQPKWTVRPTGEQLGPIRAVLERAPAEPGRYMLGPFQNEGGQVTYNVFIASGRGSDSVYFMAIVDAETWVGSMLQDISPGYMIAVNDGETRLFERDSAAADIPESWRVSGRIRNEFDVVWSVEHAPTAELVKTLRSSAESFVLVTGLVISVLLGSLVLANGRTSDRAREAIEAQRELAKLNTELEGIVRSRTQELEQRTQDLETVFFSVGHDLRAPLNSVNLSAQVIRRLAEEDSVSETMSAAIHRFGDSLEAMNNTLNQVLEMGHVVEDTRVQEPIDMRALVMEVFAQLSCQDDGSSVDFRVGDIPAATGNPAMIRTLFTNLLSNSLKYSRDQDDRRIDVGADTVDGATEYFVRDNGQGFDDKSAAGMFDAFQRLRDGQRKEGMGLGLYIVSRIVQRHGGLIRAEGAPGKGATVYFTLEPSTSGPDE
ncbi:MAG: ATP-binding protein [Planctomycetes bacterium]|nr:ATP-binding protein [Planctomycetota bacterium]